MSDFERIDKIIPRPDEAAPVFRRLPFSDGKRWFIEAFALVMRRKLLSLFLGISFCLLFFATSFLSLLFAYKISRVELLLVPALSLVLYPPFLTAFSEVSYSDIRPIEKTSNKSLKSSPPSDTFND